MALSEDNIRTYRILCRKDFKVCLDTQPTFDFRQSTPQPVLCIILRVEAQGKFIMKIVHAPSLIESVRTYPKTIATDFYLKAALPLGILTGSLKKARSQAITPAIARNSQLHDFANTPSMVKLALHAQIDAAQHPPGIDTNKTSIVFVDQLFTVYLTESIDGQRFPFHFANQCINGLTIAQSA